MKKNIIPLKLLNIFNDKKIKIIFEQYLDYLNSKSLSENTIRNYFRDLIEYFEYLSKHIKAPMDPIIPLKNKFLDSNGLANPKTKKWEWNKVLASDVFTIIESLIMPKLFGSSFKSPWGIWSQGIVIRSINDNLHSTGHKILFKRYIANKEISR